MNTKHSHIAGGILLATVLLLAAYNFYKAPEPHVLGEVHEHADFKVFLNGNEFNFSQSKYMSGKINGSNQTKLLSNFVHLHDLDGGVVHKHINGVTMGMLFKTLSMVFNSTCFATDNGRQYCNGQGGKLSMIVNGKKTSAFGDYQFGDLDRMLISFGNESGQELQAQYASVSDRACIQSLKCPQRGTPEPEASCAGSDNGCAAEPSHG